MCYLLTLKNIYTRNSKTYIRKLQSKKNPIGLATLRRYPDTLLVRQILTIYSINMHGMNKIQLGTDSYHQHRCLTITVIAMNAIITSTTSMLGHNYYTFLFCSQYAHILAEVFWKHFILWKNNPEPNWNQALKSIHVLVI